MDIKCPINRKSQHDSHQHCSCHATVSFSQKLRQGGRRGILILFLQGRNLKCRKIVSWLWLHCLSDVKHCLSSSILLYVEQKRGLKKRIQEIGNKIRKLRGSRRKDKAKEKLKGKKTTQRDLHSQRLPKRCRHNERNTEMQSQTYTLKQRENREDKLNKMQKNVIPQDHVYICTGCALNNSKELHFQQVKHNWTPRVVQPCKSMPRPWDPQFLQQGTYQYLRAEL